MTALDRPFVIADVFTQVRFGGNQLAVLPDARGLSDRAMQAVAREFNFAESAFLLPAEDRSRAGRLRIFSPLAELPFAGHPVIGAAAVLGHLGLVPAGAPIVFELGIGPVPVEVRPVDPAANRWFTRLTLERPLDAPAERPDPDRVAAALSLGRADVIAAWFAGAGVPYCYAHLASRDAVDRAVLDRAAWREHFAGAWASQLYPFAGDLTSGERLYARMFAPAFGIEEDPATGSACVALAGWLAERDRSATRSVELTVEQGVRLGRPSLLVAGAEKSPGRPLRMSVGGSTVMIASGTISVPTFEEAGR